MNEPTAKKLIESAPEHILNMSDIKISASINRLGSKLGFDLISNPIEACQRFAIAIDWAGELCICYPFTQSHTPTLGEQATLLSISDRNPRIAIAKAVIWQQEVLAKSN